MQSPPCGCHLAHGGGRGRRSGLGSGTASARAALSHGGRGTPQQCRETSPLPAAPPKPLSQLPVLPRLHAAPSESPAPAMAPVPPTRQADEFLGCHAVHVHLQRGGCPDLAQCLQDGSCEAGPILQGCVGPKLSNGARMRTSVQAAPQKRPSHSNAHVHRPPHTIHNRTFLPQPRLCSPTCTHIPWAPARPSPPPQRAWCT